MGDTLNFARMDIDGGKPPAANGKLFVSASPQRTREAYRRAASAARRAGRRGDKELVLRSEGEGPDRDVTP